MQNKKELSPEARAARAAYQREWRRKNPEKYKAAVDRHWEKVAAQQNKEREGEA